MDKLIIKQKMIHLREDSFWYDGLIATLGKFRLYAVGDICIRFQEDKGMIYSDDSAVKRANELSYIDNNLQDVEWINNNWFEVGWIEKNKDGKNIMEFDFGIVEDDYQRAIVMLENYYKEDKLK